MKVYIAAPLFSEVERKFNLSISNSIENTCAIYLPQRDGPLVSELVAGGVSHFQAGRMAYEKDIEALRWCDTVIAVFDGRALDEGVCIEVGFAKALGKHIIGIKTDVRSVLPWGNNPIVDGCVDEWVVHPDELPACIERVHRSLDFPLHVK